MSAFYVTLVHFTKPTGDTIETGSSSISKCKEEPVVFSSKEATKWGAVRECVQSHRNHALMCEDSGVITKSYHPFLTLHKDPSPASHHFFIPSCYSSLWSFLVSLTNSYSLSHLSRYHFFAQLQCLTSFCVPLVFFFPPFLSFPRFLIWHVMLFKLFIWCRNQF